MLLSLTASVFETLDDDIHLLGFLQRAMAGRFYLRVKSPNSPAYQNWLSRLSRARRSAWETQLSLALRDGAVFRLKTAEVVSAPDSAWEVTPPRLSISDALAVIDVPFKIMVENGRGDRAFLMAMATEAQKLLLERLEATDQLMFQGVGGIGELRTTIKEHVAPKGHRRLTHWVMFDSDAPAPGEESNEATMTSDLCKELGLQFHALERRAIENYLPKWALYEWAKSNRADKAKRRRLVDAFWEMNDDQRRHFHMKYGLSSSPKPSEVALYQGLSPLQRSLLSSGFGKKIGDLFGTADGNKLRYHIEKEGGASELAGSLAALVELVRTPNG